MQGRQAELFASQDWKVLYRAFTQINFNASDPTSINQALRDYLRTNYPEDFNDWIESSEFVAIVDLLSWLAGTLAFKTDINARENFLETATARESILRLARFLSYSPSRCRPATGLVKIVEVSSDDDLTDTTGRSLQGRRLLWNNTDDADWYENFVSVLNAAFVSTNPFGTPLKSGSVGEVPSHLYRLNSRWGDNSYGFNSVVSGNSAAFEVCNVDFTVGETYFERVPDPNAALHLLFRNDSNGNASKDTGFFMLFKQGTMQRSVYNIDNPVENQLINIDSANVTEDDVWVQSLSDRGFVKTNWKRVPALYSENITFNTLSPDQRDIFTVVTRESDTIAVRFSDGIFGTAPQGRMAVSYRTANGEQYVIKPLDIDRIQQVITYTNRAGVERHLTITFSLYDTVSNATTRETDAMVKRRAPAVYSTQSRMVSGEDYNVFPLSSNLAVKLKAVQRIYAGHSRYIDLNDPTSTYQDVSVFGDDGAIYVESGNAYEEIPTSLNRSPTEIIDQHIEPMLNKPDVRAYVLARTIDRSMAETGPLVIPAPVGTWNQSTAARYSSSGWFSSPNSLFKPGAHILFKAPSGYEKWVAIMEVNGTANSAPQSGEKGPVTLAEAIPTGSTMDAIVPAYVPILSPLVRSQLADKIDLGLSFSLWYDPMSGRWLVLDFTALGINPAPPTDYPGAIKVTSVESSGGLLWKLSGRGNRLVFESMRKVKWYQNSARVSDSFTGARRMDTISVLGTNPDLNSDIGAALKRPSVFNTRKMYYYNNGTHEPRRVLVSFIDDDEDGGWDNPDAFWRLVAVNGTKSTLFWRLGEAFGASSFIPCYDVVVYDTQALFAAVTSSVTGNIAYVAEHDAFHVYDGVEWIEQPRRDWRLATGRGPNLASKWVSAGSVYEPKVDPLYFHWKHYAQTHHRIDPSLTNIIDIFVLSSEYDFLTRQWIANGSKITDAPSPPTELDLRLQFRSFEEFKMFSDEIVWRPVTYKYLFGAGSEDANLRAKFKVVKLPNTTVADGEIKSRVIRAVNQFFDVTRWDFGETFYFTELAAFVHQQLAGVIGSFVIVPQDEEASFGDVFEVTAAPDEMFISTAQVTDVEIISSNTSGNLRIR